MICFFHLQRAVGSTNMNELSSRSHAVFIIIAENSVIKDVDQGAESVADQEMAKTRQSFKVRLGDGDFQKVGQA